MKSTIKKIWELFTRREKKTFISLSILTVVSALLEMLSLSLIVPATSILIESDGSPYNFAFVSAVNNLPDKYRITFGMTLLVLVFVLKNFFNAVVKYRQFLFQSNIEIRVSNDLLTKYLDQSYSYHLQTNSSELSRNLIDIAQLVETTVAPMFLLISEFLVIIGVTALLLVVEPKGFLAVVSIFSLFGILFIRWSSHLASGYGEDRKASAGNKLRVLYDCFHGIKEIQVYSRESLFVRRFKNETTKNAISSRKFLYLKYLPTYFLEVIVVGALGFLATILVVSEKSPTTIVTTLAVFGGSAFRILPSLNRTVNAIQNLKFGSVTLESVVLGMGLLSTDSDSNKCQKLDFEHQIVMRDVCFKYSDESKQVITDVNMTIAKGTSLGIIGSSGAGKSTIVDLLLGIHLPTSGCIEVDGISISQHIAAWRRNIGYVPQEIFLSDLTIRENIAFGLEANNIDDAMIEKAVRGAQLETFISKLERGVNSLVGENGLQISGGERQRIGIARALYSNPKVLLLDEATSSLDINTEEDLMRAIENLKNFMTIIIVTHRLNNVRSCEKIALVNDGQIRAFGDFKTVCGSLPIDLDTFS